MGNICTGIRERLIRVQGIENYMNNIRMNRMIYAVAKDGDDVRTAKIQLRSNHCELVWGKTSSIAGAGLGTRAIELCPEMRNVSGGNSERLLAGFDSESVLFKRLEIPTANKAETESIVNFQAQAQIPLEPAQMEMVYRLNSSNGEHCNVTMAATRRGVLRDFVSSLGPVKPDGLLLDSEAVVAAWRNLFGGSDMATIVVSIGAHNTKVCRADKGKLIDSSSIDVGVSELSEGVDSIANVQVVDRFIQDLRSVIELFEIKGTVPPVHVLSDKSYYIESLVRQMNVSGIKAYEVAADADAVIVNSSLGGDARQAIYDYRVCLGLALLGQVEREHRLNIFDNIYLAGEKPKKAKMFNSLIASAVAVVVAGVLLLLTFYVADVQALKKIEKNFDNSKVETNVTQLIAKRNLKTEVAKHRPELLEFITIADTNEVRGIGLDGIEFTKNKPIILKGKADNQDALFKYQDYLREQKDISDVKIQSMPKDSKSNKLNFVMGMHYKEYTKSKRTNLLNR